MEVKTGHEFHMNELGKLICIFISTKNIFQKDGRQSQAVPLEGMHFLNRLA